MTAPEWPGPWCTRCGGPAAEREASIDPRHPIGYCRPLDPYKRGCGRIILTRDRDEADAVDLRRRRKYATGRHNQHLRDKRPSALCDLCDAALVRAAPPRHAR